MLSRDLYHLILAGSLLITAAPALLTTSSWESVASRTTDCTDNHPLVDQWNAASRRNDSIEREQIVEMHKLDTVLDDLRWPSGRSRLLAPCAPQSEWRRASRRPFVGRQQDPKEIICLEVAAYIAALDCAT
jgi:hypothetical protein